MSLERFAVYADAFERAYATGDWDALAPYFTEDAVYEIRMDGSTAGHYRGREAVFACLAWVTSHFDKRFASRRLVPLEPPQELGGRVRLHGTGVYTLPDGACCHLVMEEHAEFEGGRISRLTDNIFPGGIAEVDAIRRRYPGTFPEPMLPPGD
jgi:ketosteroid isomerase-like protein